MCVHVYDLDIITMTLQNHCALDQVIINWEAILSNTIDNEMA